ncbi:hypothetical protein PAHAL_9G084200 [Panicum hallii]|jgi:hypothetical protein|uniref:Secreted protein n=1 Tax=Panicum hallii TaxID=206008 RepID=A0A2T8I0L0_9POAL|nr:hypothetical protein PAHAL_9G084200 [Panicum hallii]
MQFPFPLLWSTFIVLSEQPDGAMAVTASLRWAGSMLTKKAIAGSVWEPRSRRRTITTQAASTCVNASVPCGKSNTVLFV